MESHSFGLTEADKEFEHEDEIAFEDEDPDKIKKKS